MPDLKQAGLYALNWLAAPPVYALRLLFLVLVRIAGAALPFLALTGTVYGAEPAGLWFWIQFHWRRQLTFEELRDRAWARGPIVERIEADKEAGQDQVRKQIAGAQRAWALLKWDLWAVKMRIHAACFSDAVQGISEQIDRELHHYNEQYRKQMEERRLREREERERVERRQRDRARAERERQERQREQQRRQERQRQDGAKVDAFTAARELLGLAEHFTEKAFKKAYRKAMLAAHPDMGGSTEAAQAINAACDLIRMRMGW